MILTVWYFLSCRSCGCCRNLGSAGCTGSQRVRATFCARCTLSCRRAERIYSASTKQRLERRVAVLGRRFVSSVGCMSIRRARGEVSSKCRLESQKPFQCSPTHVMDEQPSRTRSDQLLTIDTTILSRRAAYRWVCNFRFSPMGRI